MEKISCIAFDDDELYLLNGELRYAIISEIRVTEGYQ